MQAGRQAGQEVWFDQQRSALAARRGVRRCRLVPVVATLVSHGRQAAAGARRRSTLAAYLLSVALYSTVSAACVATVLDTTLLSQCNTFAPSLAPTPAFQRPLTPVGTRIPKALPIQIHECPFRLFSNRHVLLKKSEIFPKQT